MLHGSNIYSVIDEYLRIPTAFMIWLMFLKTY